MSYPNNTTFITTDLKLRNSRYILSKVKNIALITHFCHTYRLEYFHRSNRRDGLRYNICGRCSNLKRGFPRFVVKIHGIPTLLFQVRIIMLSSIYTVKHQRPKGSFPAFIRSDNFSASIVKGEFDVKTKTRSLTPFCTIKQPYGRGLMIIPPIAQ